MDRLISYFVALAVAAGLMFAWDRHDPMGWHARVLFWRVGFDLPDSLAVQRDKALAANATAARDLGQCRAGSLALQAAATAQNAAVEALRREGEARVAQSQRAVSAARAVAASERVQAQAILEAKPATADLCQAAETLLREDIHP